MELSDLPIFNIKKNKKSRLDAGNIVDMIGSLLGGVTQGYQQSSDKARQRGDEGAAGREMRTGPMPNYGGGSPQTPGGGGSPGSSQIAQALLGVPTSMAGMQPMPGQGFNKPQTGISPAMQGMINPQMSGGFRPGGVGTQPGAMPPQQPPQQQGMGGLPSMAGGMPPQGGGVGPQTMQGQYPVQPSFLQQQGIPGQSAQNMGGLGQPSPPQSGMPGSSAHDNIAKQLALSMNVGRHGGAPGGGWQQQGPVAGDPFGQQNMGGVSREMPPQMTQNPGMGGATPPSGGGGGSGGGQPGYGGHSILDYALQAANRLPPELRNKFLATGYGESGWANKPGDFGDQGRGGPHSFGAMQFLDRGMLKQAGFNPNDPNLSYKEIDYVTQHPELLRPNIFHAMNGQNGAYNRALGALNAGVDPRKAMAGAGSGGQGQGAGPFTGGGPQSGGLSDNSDSWQAMARRIGGQKGMTDDRLYRTMNLMKPYLELTNKQERYANEMTRFFEREDRLREAQEERIKNQQEQLKLRGENLDEKRTHDAFMENFKMMEEQNKQLQRATSNSFAQQRIDHAQSTLDEAARHHMEQEAQARIAGQGKISREQRISLDRDWDAIRKGVLAAGTIDNSMMSDEDKASAKKQIQELIKAANERRESDMRKIGGEPPGGGRQKIMERGAASPAGPGGPNEGTTAKPSGDDETGGYVPGQVYNGHKFKGGNYKDRSNWE